MAKDLTLTDDAHGEEVRAVVAYKREAELARRERVKMNARNWDFYHNKQDFSHKKAGQSQEFLPKQSMAVEQITSFIHQGLVDLGEWFSIDPEDGNKDPLVTKDEARKLLSRQLSKAGFFQFMSDSIKAGLLESLMVAKVHGRTVEKPVFFTEKSKNREVLLKRRKNEVWELRLDLIRGRDWFPDPTEQGTRKPLYSIHQIEMDLWELREEAENAPGDYDLGEIDRISASIQNSIEKYRREQETNQSPTDSNYRKRVTIDECWGHLIDVAGKMIAKNVVCTVANGNLMIRPPRPNPNWHGTTPFISAALIRVPHSVWHKALMDAPTDLNKAGNELFNLILDSGMMAVFGVRQVREDWIDNADEMSNGISPGFVAKVNMQCPAGAKAIETVSTGAIDMGQALQVSNTINAEGQAASLSNDLRQGIMPNRAVKATEVVEASQSITSVFTGIAKGIEDCYIEPVLNKSWLTMWQNADDWDSEEVIALVGPATAEKIAKLSPEERFEKIVNGHKFKVFGITQTLNKIKDFKKMTSLLQTISGSPVLMEEFSKQYDMGKLLTEIIKSLDINVDKIKQDEDDAAMSQLGQAQSQASPGGGGSPIGGLPDQQSQTPQMSATSPESNISAIPQTHFSGRAFNGG